jgi:hypothetical protein
MQQKQSNQDQNKQNTEEDAPNCASIGKKIEEETEDY